MESHLWTGSHFLTRGPERKMGPYFLSESQDKDQRNRRRSCKVYLQNTLCEYIQFSIPTSAVIIPHQDSFNTFYLVSLLSLWPFCNPVFTQLREESFKDINPIMSLPLLQIFQCSLKIVSKLIRRASHNLAPNTVSTSIHRLFLSPHPSHFSHTGLPSTPLNLPSIPPGDHSYLVLSFPSDINLNITSHLGGTFLQCFHL